MPYRSRLLAVSFILASALLALPGCGSTREAVQDADLAARTAGGPASSDATKVDTVAVIAQPGGSAFSSKVVNEDQLSNAQAGDAPQLVLGGGGRAALEFMSKPDPVADGMAARLATLNQAYANAADSIARAGLETALTALEDRMIEHQPHAPGDGQGAWPVASTR